MKKKLQLLFTFLFTFTSIYLKASDVPSDALDLAQGKIYFRDGGYSVGSSSGTLNSHSGTYNIYSSEDTTDYGIYVISGAGDLDASFWSVTTNFKYGFLTDKSEGDVILRFNGTNKALGTSRGIGLYNNAQHDFTIAGDSLTIAGYIGPSVAQKADSIGLFINISYLNIDLQSGSEAIANSSYPFKKVTISDTSLITCKGGIYADTIIIGKTSVSASSLSVPAINFYGDTVYCITITSGGSDTIMVTDTINKTTETYTFKASHPGDDNYYLYLPNGSYTLENGDGLVYVATVDDANVTASLDPKIGDGIIDVSSGDISINEDVYYIGAQPYTYSGRNFELFGATTLQSVIISGGADTIILNNVDIQLTNGCALEIANAEDLAIILDGNNTLISGSDFAGLQKTTLAGLLTISGTNNDTLIATGGADAAGIGGSSKSPDCSNINITGGVIEATGGGNGAGIGGGNCGDGNYITISGGQITAVSENEGCGLGGGKVGYGNYITISGGKVIASSNGGSCGIGSYANFISAGDTISGGIIKAIGGSSGNALTNGIVITGGTVYTEMISVNTDPYKWGRAFCQGYITGGSVNLLGTGTKTSIYSYGEEEGRPVDVDSVLLYRSQYIMPGITEMTLVDSISINGNQWNCNDLYTDTDGSVYLWLPSADADTVFISANGSTYAFLGSIVEYDDYTEADEAEGIIEYGNYLWQVPVNIEEFESGSINVATFNDTLNSTGYACYKTNISVWAEEIEGYTFDSLRLNDSVSFTDTTFMICDTVSISAYYTPFEYEVTIVTPENGSITAVAGGSEIASGDMVAFGTEINITATADDGYSLDSLVINDVVDTTNETTTITVKGAISLAAYFSEDPEENNEEENSISELSTDKVWIYNSDKMLFIHSSESATISVYNISGVQVASQQAIATTTEIPVQHSGLYIIKVSSKSGATDILKCIVK